MKETTIKNQYGREFDYDAVENMMDSTLREVVHSVISPCSPQDFFNVYCVSHRSKFKEEFEFNTLNPQV